MPATRRYRTALLAVFLLPLAGTGCGFLTDSCRSETRDVTASTGEIPTGVPSDNAQVLLSQDRGRPGRLTWVAEKAPLPSGAADSFPLQQHVLTARLLDSGADMALLLELPVRTIEGSFDGIGGDLLSYGGPIPFDQLFDLVQAGRAVLELGTDIPDRERLLRPLETVVFRYWRRLPCD